MSATNWPVFHFAGHALLAVVLAVILAACQSGSTGGTYLSKSKADDPVSALQRVNEAGAECWLASGDAAFRNLSLVPELDTSAGRPRLLLLKKGDTQGLPLLVIEAFGSPVTVRTFGPLGSTQTGKRVNADVRNWLGGPPTC